MSLVGVGWFALVVWWFGGGLVVVVGLFCLVFELLIVLVYS